MNLYRTVLRDLKKEKTILNLRIKTVEKWLGIKPKKTKKTKPNGAITKRKKRLTPERKEEISRQMKSYWAKRRKE